MHFCLIAKILVCSVSCLLSMSAIAIVLQNLFNGTRIISICVNVYSTADDVRVCLMQEIQLPMNWWMTRFVHICRTSCAARKWLHFHSSVTVIVMDRLEGVWCSVTCAASGFTAHAYLAQWEMVTGCAGSANECCLQFVLHTHRSAITVFFLVRLRPIVIICYASLGLQSRSFRYSFG